MQTVILAAGEGTRMQPLTDDVPKPLLPVASRPLIAHPATAAVEAGASRLVVVVGYQGDRIRETLGDAVDGVPVDYVDQPEQRGTADAVRVAAPALDAGPFAVINGDSLFDTSSLTALFKQSAAVGSYRVDDPTHYGVLDTTDDDSRVTGVTEKPASPSSNLVNTGAYVFPDEAREWLDVAASQRGEFELTDVLERLCERREVTAVSFDRWLDVGRPWELLAANEWKLAELAGRVDGEVHPSADLRGTVVVEAGATIDAGTVVEGPALVRSDARLGPNAYVRGATLVGPGVRVGHAVEVKNSVIMAGATAGHLSYVGDSVLGRDVNLGAGTITANLRHDGADVAMTVKGERTSTGRRKFGVVLGRGVKTGINTSLNAGISLDGGTVTRPGEMLLHNVAGGEP